MEDKGSCDTFVALPPVTANGYVIFGKNSDRPSTEVQEVIYQTAADHEQGEKLKCTYIEVDQAPHTHAVILSKPAWMWGAEMGANDQGVCIGNEAIWTKLNSDEDLQEKLLGMDLLRLGLERGGSAREALDVITSLLSQFGQGGPCSEGGQWTYYNSFLIADSSEAWVLETVGKLWAAEKITEGVRNISNQLSIQEKIDLMSPGLIEEAKSSGLYKDEDGPFNFSSVFQLENNPSTTAVDRFEKGNALLRDLSKDAQFDLKCMMKILRDENGICLSGPVRASVGSQVSLLPPGASLIPACHWFTATPNPKISIYKPFIFCSGATVGVLTRSPDFGDKDPAKLVPRFQETVDRRHDLYKGHEKLVNLLEQDDPKGHMILQNLQEFEEKCVEDTEEVLNNFDENGAMKVTSLFKHMCEIESFFYK
ncbi:hypothetical protein ACJMK2_023200 [Sinanodonta woodiana]|uniref:Secernin-2 n=1 Tax=Sinanodonta woodiana TaxID=1069815 RepID=A0ABD3T3E4_SINWO